MAKRTQNLDHWCPDFDLMERLIAIDSVTHRSNGAVVRFLEPLLKECGLKVKHHRVIENGRTFINVVAHNDSLRDPNLLVLHTHLDTVEPGPTKAWTKTKGKPLKLTSQGEKLFGLGVADVKLDFLCKILAVKKLGRRLPPIALVGSYGEERGLVGARKLLAQKWFRPRYAAVGEPSLLEIIVAHKGHLVVTLSLPTISARDVVEKKYSGLAAHSSTPHLGESAIEKALTDIVKNRLGLCRFQGGVGSNTVPAESQAWVTDENANTKRIEALLEMVTRLRKQLSRKKDTRFHPSSPTLSLNWAKTIGKRIHLTFDVRLLPTTPTRPLIASLEKFAKKAGLKVESIELDPALDGSDRGVLIRKAAAALKRAGVSPKIRTKASCTEAALYHEKGAQAFVFGPGLSIGNVHRPNEFNQISQLEKATRFYFELIQSFAEKGTLHG